eukprot:TRINITY_DN8762_c0_g3_i2.p1 TRINITY_DN8762_c0_g3~~TRINITY_DN8762_c0_g3_i2.p1  ORF type:complete len:382 (+),score=58.34 TRINITY_DN8762_c0_g3_i2:622-1767(+)
MYPSNGNQLPTNVVNHPVLKRLEPGLKEKVMDQLRMIAVRNSGGGGGGGHENVGTAFGSGPTYPMRSGFGIGTSTDYEEPAPPNHSHAMAQTTFPSDAAIQTDPPEFFDQPTGSGNYKNTTVSTAVQHHPMPQQIDSYPPRVLTPPPAALNDTSIQAGPVSPPRPFNSHNSTGIGTYADAEAIANKMAGGITNPAAVRSEAHSRLLAERVLAERSREYPEITTEYSHAAGLGFPNPSGEEAPLATGQIGIMQQQIRDEFWRHFNTEFDRAVIAARDPEVDSILAGIDDDEPAYAADSNYPYLPYDKDARAKRDDVRQDAQNLFWNEYTTSLDNMMRPGMTAEQLALFDSGHRPNAPPLPFAQPRSHSRSASPYSGGRGSIL